MRPLHQWMFMYWTGTCNNVYETTTPMDVHVLDTGKCKNVYETTTLMDVHVLDTG